MDVRDIVRKAWQITQVHLKKLVWYGFVPSFFGVIVSSGYLAYQYNAFRHSVLFEPHATSHVFGTAKTVWGLGFASPGSVCGFGGGGCFCRDRLFFVPSCFSGNLDTRADENQKL